MYKFIQKNQKKLLAIFAAGLMVVFILPNRNSGGMDRGSLPFGTLKGKTVTNSEVDIAEQQWKQLTQTTIGDPRGRGGSQSLAEAFFRIMGADSLYSEISDRPDLFFLLLKEADADGIAVPPDRVGKMLSDISSIPTLSLTDPNKLRPAVESMMRIQVLFDSVGSAVKVSEPEIRRRIAENQQVKLNVVEFDAESLKTTVSAPSDADLKAFFDRYATRPAGAPSTQPGELGFGYRYPDRVKIQYLSIPRDQVKQAVLKGRDPYDVQVEALQYYLKHQEDFVSLEPTSEPATAPTTTQATTQSATQPTTKSATTTTAPTSAPAATLPSSKPTTLPTPKAPTTRPFEEVKDQVLTAITKDSGDKLLKQVQAAVAQRLAADYDAWKANRPPTTATSQPTGYPSFEYLQKLADDIEKKFNVRLAIVDNPKSQNATGDVWIPVAELFELPKIGGAMAPGDLSIQDFVSRSAALTPPTTGRLTSEPAGLALWQFSPALTSTDGVYFFRITDAQTSHAPTDLAEVKSQIESDYRLSKAYEKANDQAETILAAAKDQGLAAAAAASHQKVTTTGYFDRRIIGGFDGQNFTPGGPIPGMGVVSESAKAQLVSEGEALLVKANPQNPHPTSIVRIPSEKKILVIELAGVSNPFTGPEGAVAKARLAIRMENQAAESLKEQLFTYDAVVKRLQWKPVNPPTSRPARSPLAAS